MEERKIGEIFEHNGEWYQCVEEEKSCINCAFRGTHSIDICVSEHKCLGHSSEDMPVIFKKLEKVGEPFSDEHFGLVQKYELKMYGYSTTDKRVCFADGYDVFIKIKQNKEDMEEKKLNLKPFDLEAAKAGKPVCTRDGRKARIICFDAKGKQPIIALFEREKSDEVIIQTYNDDGSYYGLEKEDNRDLMMLPEKKEGWVNLYPCDCMGQKRYSTKEEALKNAVSDVIATVKIEWEE